MKKIRNISKPYTMHEFFEKICESIWLPDILDYALGNGKEEIRTYEFRFLNRLDYGGSEGIYLDLYIQIPNDDKKYKLGTFKTLDTSNDAMRKMGILLADFISNATRFVNQNIDDFDWEGFQVRELKDDKSPLSSYRVCSNSEAVEKAITLIKEKANYPYASVYDLRNDVEVIYDFKNDTKTTYDYRKRA